MNINYIEEILKAIENADYERALELIDEHRGEHEFEPEFITAQAILCLQTQEYEIARDILLDGVGKHPENADLLYNLGYTYHCMADGKQALEFYRQAMERTDDADFIDEIKMLCVDIESSPDFIRSENKNLFCFIACVNNEELYKESLLYINRLEIPQGFSIECRAVRNAYSMTSGYNSAMKESDAKYKIYMHQDINILNVRFLFDLLDIFTNDKNIGMVGIIGAADVPFTGSCWDSSNILGCMYTGDSHGIALAGSTRSKNSNGDAMLVDGVLMATQYDLPWREDLFDSWHFYDASQSCEFLRKGYRIYVPDQLESDGTAKPWCLHNTKGASMAYYEKYRSVFRKEYNELLSDKNNGDPTPGSVGVSMILMVRSQYEYLLTRMDEIDKYAPEDVKEIIIAVDDSHDIDRERLGRDRIVTLLTEPGEGASSVLNRVFALADKENDILIMHCQVPFIWNCLKIMTAALYSDEDIGAVYFAAGEPSPEQWAECTRLEGWLVLLKRSALNNVGIFNEEFSTLSHVVSDYGTRLLKDGYKILRSNVFASVPSTEL